MRIDVFLVANRCGYWGGINNIIKVKGAEVMSYQQSFTDIEYANRKKKTKREEFLEMMDEIIP